MKVIWRQAAKWGPDTVLPDGYPIDGEAASVAEVATAEITDQFAVVGPAEAHRERLAQLREAGVDQFNIYLMNGDEEEQLDLYAPMIEHESALERT